MIANFIGCKVIYEVNGVEELEYKAKGLPSWLCAYFKLSIRWNATFVHKFQCVTKGIAEYLRKVYKIPSTKLLVIENGVDLDLFFPMDKSRSREKFRLPQERFIAGFIGSFAPWQGLVNTVKAIAQIDVSLPVTGVFVGGGMLRGELLKIALHAPDNRFIFIDWIPHKNVPDIISAFDLALLIREYNFNLPMGSPIKLFEYLACGVPILASPVDGIINIPGAEAIHFINPCRIDNIKKFLTELVQKHISGIEWRKRSLQRQIEIAKAHSWQLVITRLLNEIDSL